MIMIMDGNQRQIDSVWAFLSVDENGNEGICATRIGDSWHPLVTSDPDMVLKLRVLASDLRKASGRTIRLVRFESKKILEEI